MKIKVIQLGKTKEAWLKQALEHYQQRLEPFCSLEILTLPDVSVKTVNSPNEVMQKEAAAVWKAINTDDYVILLDEKGKQQNSFEFAGFLNILSDKKIVFVIGGVYGTAVELSQRADQVIALSRLTFTHRIVRLVLLEQVYRAMMINHNRKYHY